MNTKGLSWLLGQRVQPVLLGLVDRLEQALQDLPDRPDRPQQSVGRQDQLDLLDLQEPHLLLVGQLDLLVLQGLLEQAELQGQARLVLLDRLVQA